MKVKENQILIIFGASGDLTRRKLIPALYNLFKNGFLPEKFAVIGVGRTRMNDEGFRNSMHDALVRFHRDLNHVPDKDFISMLHYIALNTEDPSDYKMLKQKIGIVEKQLHIESNYVFYLATPPALYEVIPKGLFREKLNREKKGWTRVVVEKPFGSNLETARKLNLHLLKYFGEEQIYRIDHYLGKESVQNIMVTRFSNGLFEPLWNRNYIKHIEITSTENIGVENRGGYYDQAGALRDMVQNHLLQLVTLVAMEPPTVINSLAIRNETMKVLQSLKPIQRSEVADNVIRGQYLASTICGDKVKSYRDEVGVKPDSRTETFVALKLYVDNWRWGGVPFYIRTGKRLPTRVTEIVIRFKPTPHKLFISDDQRFNTDNQLILRIQPDEGILLKFGMKIPGSGYKVQEVNMDFHYSDLGNQEIPEAYQRLLLDCFQGDSTLYTRGDAVEEAWKFIDPILRVWNEERDLPIYGYPAGTWGPDISDSLIEGKDTTWRYPCKNLTDDCTFCEL